MAGLVYFATVSLDGYTADENGNLDWSAPDDEVHGFVNDRLRPVDTFLFGRRMYETMLYWEGRTVDGAPAVEKDFAGIWQATDKVVYSKTLATLSSARTRLERDFDPEGVRQMKSAGSYMTVGGAHLAADAFRARLVDEIQLFIVPVIIGGGSAALPHGLRLNLKLEEERRFENGTLFLRYSAGSRLG